MAEGSRLEIILTGSIRGEERIKASGLSLVGTAAEPGEAAKGDHYFMMLEAGRWDTGIQVGEQCHLKGKLCIYFLLPPTFYVKE